MALRSLRTQLLAWLLIPLTLFVIVNTVVTYRTARTMATVVQDRMLLGSARMIGEQVRFEEGRLVTPIPPAALALFQTAARDRVFYRVSGPRGTLLSGYDELPLVPLPRRVDEASFVDAVFRQEAVRVVAFLQPVVAAPAEGPVLIEVAQTRQAHALLAQDMLGHAVGQQLLMLLLVALLVWIGLWRSLAPLLTLRDRVLRRTPGSAEPFGATPVPSELVPLVAALDDYDRRLSQHMAVQGRFITNASHQLRTPLTVLNMQVAYAARSSERAHKDEALEAIRRSVQHGIRLVNQLLTLSRNDVGIDQPARQGEVDLADVVQRALEELGILAQAKEIDLGFETAGGPCMVRAMPGVLDELVTNLVDNALRYTPNGGVVTARVTAAPDAVILSVEDNGPGIPSALRERVFERFYRLQEEHADGSGLGLAIVRQIAAASNAVIALSDPDGHAGLVVSVRFPITLPASAAAAPERPAAGTGSRGATLPAVAALPTAE